MSVHLTLPQLFDRFPDNVAAEAWFVWECWPRKACVVQLYIGQRSGPPDAQARALSLPRLSAGFLGQD